MAYLFFFLFYLQHLYCCADIILTIAGTGAGGYSGDGGQATSATVFVTHGIAVDSNANVFINDYNQRVRKITASTGIISTYVGTGTASYSGDGGAATSATLFEPQGLCIDHSGGSIPLN